MTRTDSEDVVSLVEWREVNSVGKTTSYALLNIVMARQIKIKRKRKCGASKPSPWLYGEALVAMDNLLHEYQGGVSIATLEWKYGSLARAPYMRNLATSKNHVEPFAISRQNVIQQNDKKNKPQNLPPSDGFVYYVRWENDPFLVKIGYTSNLKNRFSSFLTCNPHRLEVLRIEETTDSHFEKILHAKFDDYRIAGEWFKYEGDLERYVTNLDVNLHTELLSLDTERIIVHYF